MAGFKKEALAYSLEHLPDQIQAIYDTLPYIVRIDPTYASSGDPNSVDLFADYILGIDGHAYDKAGNHYNVSFKSRFESEYPQDLSRKRSLNEAREAYVKGVKIHGKLIKGTGAEFDKAIRFLRKIGVQPFRIPGRWNISRIEADYRMYPSVHVGFNHLPRNRPGIPSATAEIYQFVKTKLIEVYNSYKPP